ncbi:MAG: HAD family hydrolase [Chloroflexota bacterium]
MTEWPRRCGSFVGDNPEADMQGAHNAGMRTAWLQRGRRWPTQLPRSCADLTIEALEDLITPEKTEQQV